MATVNLIMDFVLIAAAVWMVITVRGLGGIIGRGLGLITLGAVVLGVAHLLATAIHYLVTQNVLMWDSPTENFFHRIVVLLGFLVLILGFRQIQAINK